MHIRIAEDGEILLKGRNVCLGYLNDPEASAELVDPEGWMHTGDLGELDADGSLRLLGRKKDIIITAAGKNIAPEAIEADLAIHPLIAEAVVVGEGRRYLVALVTLDPEALGSWAKEHHRIGDLESLSSDPELRAEVQAAIDQVNAERSHVENIRKFRVLAHGLTAEEGELTPTMKVRRSVVYQNTTRRSSPSSTRRAEPSPATEVAILCDDARPASSSADRPRPTRTLFRRLAAVLMLAAACCLHRARARHRPAPSRASLLAFTHVVRDIRDVAGKPIAFGTARYFGGVTEAQLGTGVVGIAAGPAGQGYWLGIGRRLRVRLRQRRRLQLRTFASPCRRHRRDQRRRRLLARLQHRRGFPLWRCRLVRLGEQLPPLDADCRHGGDAGRSRLLAGGCRGQGLRIRRCPHLRLGHPAAFPRPRCGDGRDLRRARVLDRGL